MAGFGTRAASRDAGYPHRWREELPCASEEQATRMIETMKAVSEWAAQASAEGRMQALRDLTG